MYVVLLTRICPIVGRQLLYTYGPYGTHDAANQAAPALRDRCRTRSGFTEVEWCVLDLFDEPREQGLIQSRLLKGPRFAAAIA